MYGFPVWRRLPFVGLLLVILVIGYAPATTQGTTTIRISALTAPSIVRHVYIAVSSIQLHRQGLPNSTGWATISETFPVVDLLSPDNQSIAQTISSTQFHSGRYDAIKISFTNSTVVIAGANNPIKPVAAPPTLSMNATLLIAPNGNADLLLVVGFDYTSLLASPPTLSLVIVRTTLA